MTRTIIYTLKTDGTGQFTPPKPGGFLRSIIAQFVEDGVGSCILSPRQSAQLGDPANIVEIKSFNGGVATSSTVVRFDDLEVQLSTDPLYVSTVSGFDAINSVVYVTVEYPL